MTEQTVWILQGSYYHEGEAVLGVFASIEAAQRCDQLPQDLEWWSEKDGLWFADNTEIGYDNFWLTEEKVQS